MIRQSLDRVHRSPSRQKGVVLVISLIMLVLMTLFAISAIRSSTTELQITGNDQMRRELSAATQECIEQQMNSLTTFNNLISGVAAATSCSTQGGRYTVALSQIVCKKSSPIAGNSLVNTTVSTTETTYWEIVATATDTNTGATMTTTQGFRMRMPLNSCP